MIAESQLMLRREKGGTPPRPSQLKYVGLRLNHHSKQSNAERQLWTTKSYNFLTCFLHFILKTSMNVQLEIMVAMPMQNVQTQTVVTPVHATEISLAVVETAPVSKV